MDFKKEGRSQFFGIFLSLVFLDYLKPLINFGITFFVLVFKVTFVDKWPLMNPNEVALILFAYLIFIFKIGPYVMEKRNPLQINKFLILYNVFKLSNSMYLAIKFALYARDKGLFPRHCNYDEATTYTIAILYWKYMATKVLDLLDTIFFTVRKKYSQVTFLHVYHHTFMVIYSWSLLKYDPSDHWTFMAILNNTIHTIMYTYYGIAALGPNYAKYLWWKKYLTKCQMVQFVLIILHLIVQTYTSQCPMRAGSYWIGICNLSFFLFLFANFYKKNFVEKKTEKLTCTTHID